jgi:hypothetical protein
MAMDDGPWRPRRPFWRGSPRPRRRQAADDPSDLTWAWVNPRTWGLFVEGVAPAVGDDYRTVVAAAGLDQAEWLLHELGHLGLGATSAGEFLQEMGHALLFVLGGLGDGHTLHLPSGRVTGDTELAGLIPRLLRLWRGLEAEVNLVEETVCTAATVLFLDWMARCGIISPQQFDDQRHAIFSNLDPELGPMEAFYAECDPLRWATRHEPPMQAYQRARAMWYVLGLFALDPPAETVAGWWRTGVIPPGEGPRDRFARAIGALAQVPPSATPWQHLLGRLRQVRALPEVLTWGWEQVIDPRGEGDADEPSPVAELVRALGGDPETARTATPIGRAIGYLRSGQSPEDEQAHERRRAHGWSVAPFATEAIVLPLITPARRNPAAPECRFSVRLPLGRAMTRLLQRGVSIEDYARRYFTADAVDVDSGQWTVLPAPDDLRVLCAYDWVLEKLLAEGRIACARGFAGTAAGDPCRYCPLVARLGDRVRTDAGGRFPPPACFAGAPGRSPGSV